MADNEIAVYADVLRTRLPIMTDSERKFAEGLVKFYDYQGYWTEKQFNGARKLAVRMICQRDIAPIGLRYRPAFF